MRGIGQWARGPESWGPNWDPPRKKKNELRGIEIRTYHRLDLGLYASIKNINLFL